MQKFCKPFFISSNFPSSEHAHECVHTCLHKAPWALREQFSSLLTITLFYFVNHNEPGSCWNTGVNKYNYTACYLTNLASHHTLWQKWPLVIDCVPYSNLCWTAGGKITSMGYVIIFTCFNKNVMFHGFKTHIKQTEQKHKIPPLWARTDFKATMPEEEKWQKLQHDKHQLPVTLHSLHLWRPDISNTNKMLAVKLLKITTYALSYVRKQLMTSANAKIESFKGQNKHSIFTLCLG